MPAALGGASFILAMAIDGGGYLKVALLALGFLLPSTSFVLGPAMVSEVAPTRQRGTALLVTYSAITVAGFISPAVMGYALQSASQDVVASYANAFHITAGVLIVDGFGGFLLLDPTPRGAGLLPPQATAALPRALRWALSDTNGETVMSETSLHENSKADSAYTTKRVTSPTEIILNRGCLIQFGAR